MAGNLYSSRASIARFSRVLQPRQTPNANLTWQRHASTSSSPSTPSETTAKDIESLLNATPPAPQHLPNVAAQAPPRPRPRSSDRQLYLVTLALLLVTPPIVYFYYEHRKVHMGKKKEELIKSLEQKRQAWIAQNRGSSG